MKIIIKVIQRIPNDKDPNKTNPDTIILKIKCIVNSNNSQILSVISFVFSLILLTAFYFIYSVSL